MAQILVQTGSPAAPAAAATLPVGFSGGVVASVPAPTALAFTPDGRGVVTSQYGTIWVLGADGVLVPAPALDLTARACADIERGLLGVAVDPGFATNGFIFVYWTSKVDPACPSNAAGIPQNRVSRFTLRRDNTISPTSEVVLADNIPSLHGAHSAGDLRVAADGLLYVTVGDGGCQVGDPTRCASLNLNARRLHLPLGKVLRLTRTGGIPATNPYASAAGSRHCTRATGGVPAGTGPCKEIFATGLRNPFRFALRPGTSEFWVNDVGQGLWEEVNVLRRGADYGWTPARGRTARVRVSRAHWHRPPPRWSSTRTAPGARPSPVAPSSRDRCGARR